MSIHLTLAERSIHIAESNLGELDGPLAAVAKRHLREAWRCVDTLKRLEDRKHVLGQRGAA